MITTTTPYLNALVDSKVEENASLNYLDKSTTMFYNQIKPSLNALVKMPKQKTIDNILAFSKSL